MQQHRRNINTIRTRHAIFAIVTGYRRILHHQIGRIIQELDIRFRKRFQWGIGAQIVLQMLQIGHAAQNGQHAGRRPGKPKSPRGHTPLRITLFEPGDDMIRHIRQSAAQQRLHNNGRNMPFFQLCIQVFSVDIASRSMAPIDIVELNLHKIPMHLFVHGQHLIENRNRPVKRKSQIADSSRFTLLHQKIEHAVIDISSPEGLNTAIPDRMQQIIIDIIHLQILKRLTIHRNRILTGVIRKIRQLRCNLESIPGMTLQGNPGRFLRPTLYINR